MLLSTQTHSLADTFGREKAVEILAANGYDCYDLSMFEMTSPDAELCGDEGEAIIESLRKKADACGIKCNQTHAPFASMRLGDDAYNAHMNKAIKLAIKYTGMLGGGIVIVHPITVPGDPEEQKRINMEFYNDLIPTLRQWKVKAALENMFGWADGHATPAACSTPEQFCEYLDALPKDCFTACLDIGHSGLIGIPAATMIRALGHDRLGALHVHDNDMHTDMHTLPFTVRLDWKEITAALAEINYKGEFTFEADTFLNRFPGDFRPAASKFMEQTGRLLISMIENA